MRKSAWRETCHLQHARAGVPKELGRKQRTTEYALGNRGGIPCLIASASAAVSTDRSGVSSRSCRSVRTKRNLNQAPLRSLRYKLRPEGLIISPFCFLFVSTVYNCSWFNGWKGFWDRETLPKSYQNIVNNSSCIVLVKKTNSEYLHKTVDSRIGKASGKGKSISKMPKIIPKNDIKTISINHNYPQPYRKQKHVQTHQKPFPEP